MLCQAKPRDLADVGGILIAEAVASSDGPDEGREPVDQRRPGSRVAARGVPHELRRLTGILLELRRKRGAAATMTPDDRCCHRIPLFPDGGPFLPYVIFLSGSNRDSHEENSPSVSLVPQAAHHGNQWPANLAAERSPAT